MAGDQSATFDEATYNHKRGVIIDHVRMRAERHRLQEKSHTFSLDHRSGNRRESRAKARRPTSGIFPSLCI